MLDLLMASVNVSVNDWRWCVRSTIGLERLICSGNSAPRSLFKRLCTCDGFEEGTSCMLASRLSRLFKCSAEGYPRCHKPRSRAWISIQIGS